MITTTFTSNGTFIATASLAVTMSAVGAGGAGSITGNGGSGGSYAEAYATLLSGSYTIVVGQATTTDGGNSYIASGSGKVLLRAPGGKQDGSVAHQETLLTGSKYATYGGYGSNDFQGYSSYNGSGGGGAGGQTGNGGNGQSAFFSTPNAPASGGLGNTASGNGGAGAFYYAGAATNRVVSAQDGVFPGGGGGGSYDYGASTAGAGANGKIIIVS